ncbi:MAG: FAD-binding oxidoreductase [Acidobacteria bacterium]|nr:FAD-binding oxidoreductase [Acidobacteriota bacterium]
MKRCEIVISGAGIAGVATAYYLSVKYGQARVVLIDKLLPMSLTTSKSGENFRDYWPQHCMASFAGRSLDLMQELADQSGDAFDMRFFGYDFVSESANREVFPSDALRASPSGLRRNCDREAIRRQYPHLAETIRQVVHIERAGSIDVYALGSLLLSRARDAGVELVCGTVDSIDQDSSGFALHLSTAGGEARVTANRLVLAAGPFVDELAGMLGIELPVESFLQRKIVIPDPDRIIPRDMPFTVFADPQTFDWSDEETELIDDDPDYQWLLDEFPGGLHVKPESNDQIKLGWAYNRASEPPKWDPRDDISFPSIVLRGASRFIPALDRYVKDRIPTPVVQYSGYYTRTRENWPLIGPLGLEGLYTVAALSGYGTMCACAAGELCADWMMGGSLPDFARNFHPDRYSDQAILAEIDGLESDGQL